MEYVRKDMDEIRDALKVLPTLATKKDLEGWRWQWVATGAAIIAIILGGMAFLTSTLPKSESAAPAQVVVIPAPPAGK